MISLAWRSLCFLVLSCFCIPFFAAAQQSSGPVELINSGAIMQEASKQFEEKNYKNAIGLYQNISKSDTNYNNALYELSYAYYADSQYDKSLQAAAEGIRLFPEMKGKFMLLQASVLDDMDKKTEAIQMYTQCIQLDVFDYSAHYNRAVTYNQMEQYDSAFADLKKCLLINPFYASGHYLMAMHYLRKGNIVASVLALQTYLIIAPEGRYLNGSIQWLSKIAKASDDVMEYAAKADDSQLGSFAPIQAVLLSKAALDKSYKLKVSLEDNIVRQVQVVNEQLQIDAGSDDFAQQVYVPFLKQLMDKNYFEPHVYTMFGGLDIADIQNWNKRNKKVTEPYFAFANDYLRLIRITQEMTFNKRAQCTQCYLFEDGYVKGTGLCKNQDLSKYHGSWQLYYENGQLKEKGQFDEQQNRQGEWATYHENGTLKEVSQYKDNLLNGLSKGWHENGNPWFEYTLQMGKTEGKAITYFYNGLIRTEQQYKNDVKDGEEIEYTYQGILFAKANYREGKKQGLTTLYHPGGKVREQLNYTDGLEDGQYQSFYLDGQPFETGTYVAGKRQGLWTSLHENGKPKDSTTYSDNEVTGPFSEYFDNGNISRKGNYSKKKLDGLLYDYASDGKLYSMTLFDNGRLREITYYNKAGAVISSTNTRGDRNLIVSYSPNGYKYAEGYYNKEGYRNGSYTTFYPNGKVREQSTYTEGELDGLSTERLFTGQPWKELTFKKGKQDGYYKSYFTSGKLSTEGWMVADEKQQLFRFYNINGSFDVDEYYLDNDLNGFSTSYYPNNKPSFVYRYDHSWLMGWEQYDSSGKLLSTANFPAGKGAYETRHFNGNVMVRAAYEAYQLHGKYESFYYNGKPRLSMQYRYGKSYDSAITRYFNGKIESRGLMVNNEKHGKWLYYFEDGKLRESELNKHGELHGENIFYRPDGSIEKSTEYKEGSSHGNTNLYNTAGELMIQIHYQNGYAISYSYTGKDGKLVPAISINAVKDSAVGYYKNGVKSAVFHFENEDEHGERTLYHNTGAVYSVEQRHIGYVHGVRKTYFANGKLQKEESFYHGRNEGPLKEYFPSGKLKSEKTFVNDDPHGTWKYYSEAGTVTETRVYFHGQLLSVQ